MGTGSLCTQAAAPVLFVFAEVSWKPEHIAVAFKGKNMCGDAIQKPAIVGDDQRGAGEGFQRRLPEPAAY